MKIVFLKETFETSSLSEKLFTYLSYSESYNILFEYYSTKNEKRLFLINKKKYNNLVSIIPNLVFPINSSNIQEIMTISGIDFVSDLKCNMFLASEEELLYFRLKHEDVYSDLIQDCSDYSGNIMDYV